MAFINKMLNNCERKVIGILMRNPLEVYSVNQLAKETNLAYPYVYDSIKRLENEALLSVKKIGKSNLCRIRFDNPEMLAIVSMINTQNFLYMHSKINNLTKQLKEALNDELYVMLLFGSHAKAKATKKSDIDLFFIIKDKKNIELFRKKINSVVSKLSYNIEFEVSTMEWFYEMLGDKTTVGREIFKSNIVLHNAEAYFYLVRKYDQRKGY